MVLVASAKVMSHLVRQSPEELKVKSGKENSEGKVRVSLIFAIINWSVQALSRSKWQMA